MSTGEGDVRYIYTGDGGLNKAFFGLAHAWESKRDSLGNGWRVSAGANYNHLFGQLVESPGKPSIPLVVSITAMRAIDSS